MTVTQTQSLRCSFCGKAHDAVWKLIAGPHAAICDECVDVCAGIIAEVRRTTPPRSTGGSCSPADPGTTG